MEKYQTLPRRVLAFIIDGFVLSVLAAFQDLLPAESPYWLSTLAETAISVLSVAYGIFFVYRFGATPGKMATGLKIVSNAAEQAVSLRQAVLREAPVIVFAVVSLTLLIAFDTAGDSPDSLLWVLGGLMFVVVVWVIADTLCALINGKSRALHDFLGGTVVVKILPPGPGASAHAN